MSHSSAIPDEALLQKALERSKKTRQELKVASLDLKELILALEKHNLEQRQRLVQKHSENTHPI